MDIKIQSTFIPFLSETKEAPHDYSSLDENGSGSDPGTYEDEHERNVGTYDYTFKFQQP